MSGQAVIMQHSEAEGRQCGFQQQNQICRVEAQLAVPGGTSRLPVVLLWEKDCFFFVSCIILPLSSEAA